jgi:hypothetical protein
MSALCIDISPQIYNDVQTRVMDGWFKDIESVVEEAIRRYIESHPVDITDKFIKEDIEWGLHGTD